MLSFDDLAERICGLWNCERDDVVRAFDSTYCHYADAPWTLEVRDADEGVIRVTRCDAAPLCYEFYPSPRKITKADGSEIRRVRVDIKRIHLGRDVTAGYAPGTNPGKHYMPGGISVPTGGPNLGQRVKE